ncbi:MAG: hypothetical protein P4M11_10265 [Candidatus Pacebacteria bacterium]|nr:hypothetical protein [Candidatus Paceibacterota bacterium]
MLQHLIEATIHFHPESRERPYRYYYVYFLPYYGGLLLSGVLPYAKRWMTIWFNLADCLGILVLAVFYDTESGRALGVGLIHFAGGFFEGITAVYCKV